MSHLLQMGLGYCLVYIIISQSTFILDCLWWEQKRIEMWREPFTSNQASFFIRKHVCYCCELYLLLVRYRLNSKMYIEMICDEVHGWAASLNSEYTYAGAANASLNVSCVDCWAIANIYWIYLVFQIAWQLDRDSTQKLVMGFIKNASQLNAKMENFCKCI